MSGVDERGGNAEGQLCGEVGLGMKWEFLWIRTQEFKLGTKNEAGVYSFLNLR